MYTTFRNLDQFPKVECKGGTDHIQLCPLERASLHDWTTKEVLSKVLVYIILMSNTSSSCLPLISDNNRIYTLAYKFSCCPVI
jgi:hypothetical protein